MPRGGRPDWDTAHSTCPYLVQGHLSRRASHQRVTPLDAQHYFSIAPMNDPRDRHLGPQFWAIINKFMLGTSATALSLKRTWPYILRGRIIIMPEMLNKHFFLSTSRTLPVNPFKGEGIWRKWPAVLRLRRQLGVIYIADFSLPLTRASPHPPRIAPISVCFSNLNYHPLV